MKKLTMINWLEVWPASWVEGLKIAIIILTYVDFTSACNKHDECYGTCGASKAACDVKFHGDLKALCSHFEISSNWMLYALEIALGSLDTICSVVADIYYAVVAVGGSDAYEKAQDKTCKWESCKRS